MSDFPPKPFVRTFVRPKLWNVWAKFGVFLTLILGFMAGIYLISNFPDIWVWPNRILIFLLLTWYFLDVTTSRQQIYRLFNDTEDTIKLEVRFFRRALLVFACILAAVHKFTPQLNADYFLPILIGVIAAFGWMYTNFRNEVADRANNTLNIISVQYGAEENALRNQFRLFSNHEQYRTVYPKSMFDVKLSEVSDDQTPIAHSNTTFTQIANRLLNELNRVALGVREGRYDSVMIESLLRPRYIRYAYILSEFIREETEATIDRKTGQYCAQNRTWEHFLWLISRLPDYESDKLPIDARKKYFVRPPIHPIRKKSKNSR